MLGWLVACDGEGAPTVTGGALGEGPLNPFPSVELVGGDGRLAINGLPHAEDGVDWDYDRLNWRDGFSPVQSSIVRLHVSVDPASVGGQEVLGTGGPARIVDLDTGEEIPCFAEVDAYEEQDDAERTLIVRPMRAIAAGSRVAVLLTSAVTHDGGQALELPAAEGHYAELRDELAALGQADVVLAWDFPIGDGTAPVRAMDPSVPAAWTFTNVRDADDGEDLPPQTWRHAVGTYTTDDWLEDDVRLVIDEDGVPALQGEVESYLFVHIPDSVRDAEPGTVPVVVFGHGILGEPRDYLDDEGDGSGTIDVADRMGAIFVATVWRGLTYDDTVHAIDVASDFGRFHELTDQLAQGVANTRALVRLVREGDLLEDDVFAGLGDPTEVHYMGISLGAIEGSVMLANTPEIEHAVLHVGGSAWSTMLERSSNWPPFESVVVRTVPDPGDRQLLYAASQLLWDQVDPASYVEDLKGRTLLWQEAIGDNQVPNITTELLMRSVGVPLGGPAVTSPLDIDEVALTAVAPAFTQFDPEKEPPPTENRPSPDTDAHSIPRVWEGCKAQMVDFYAAGSEGQVVHHCGEAPCSASNPGE
jgi:hypothetical protein